MLRTRKIFVVALASCASLGAYAAYCATAIEPLVVIRLPRFVAEARGSTEASVDVQLFNPRLVPVKVLAVDLDDCGCKVKADDWTELPPLRVLWVRAKAKVPSFSERGGSALMTLKCQTSNRVVAFIDRSIPVLYRK